MASPRLATLLSPAVRLGWNTRGLLAALALLVAACGAPSNTAFLPIGSRCDRNDQCGTSPFACALSGYPGGYCEKGCATDGDCPTDALCIPSKQCRRRCKADSDCRTGEGYACLDRLATATVCDIN